MQKQKFRLPPYFYISLISSQKQLQTVVNKFMILNTNTNTRQWDFTHTFWNWKAKCSTNAKWTMHERLKNINTGRPSASLTHKSITWHSNIVQVSHSITMRNTQRYRSISWNANSWAFHHWNCGRSEKPLERPTPTKQPRSAKNRLRCSNTCYCRPRL